MKPTKTSQFSPDIEALFAAERIIVEQPDEVGYVHFCEHGTRCRMDR